MHFVHISVRSLNAKIDIATTLEAPKFNFSPYIFIFILKGSEDIRSAFGSIQELEPNYISWYTARTPVRVLYLLFFTLP